MRIGEDPSLADRRVREWFLREQARRSQEQANAVIHPARPRPVITISRQYGAGGRTVAALVAQKMGPGWEVWDREIIEAMAHNAQARREMIEALDERTRSWIHEMAADIANVPTIEPLGYRRHLTQVLLALAQQGQKVIVGRGANFILKQALNVRLRAALEFRIQQVMRLENIGHDEALRRIHKVDRERADFTRRVFDRDIEDPDAYDMIIRTNAIGFDATAEAIAAAARAMFA